jgi:glycerol-3-phosphate acyltransferase PlsY
MSEYLLYFYPIVVVAGYLLGSIPTAYLVTRFREGKDIRRLGSGNVGTLNTISIVGIGSGIIVLLVDAGKGIAAILLARVMNMPVAVVLISGFAAAVGHRYPVFLGFRGGKSGAITVGMLFLLMPKAIPIYTGATLLGLIITRHIPFSYISAFIVFAFAGWFIYHSAALSVFSLAFTAFVVINHYSTIDEIREQGFRAAIIRPSFKDLIKDFKKKVT